MLTDNNVLVRKLRVLPALMCAQRKAKKKIVTEEDSVIADINAFGNEIGKITNRVTSMFEVQARFDKDSEEYKVLDYRIKSGQLFQQNSIDKAKGIIAKPMPKEWYNRHSVLQIEDPGKREFYLRIIADRKPYFMRYIYPDLMKRYNNYIKNSNRKAQCTFGKSVAELYVIPNADRSAEERGFLSYYERMMPVGDANCVMNRICRRFEEEFDRKEKREKGLERFDYSILKSDAEYSKKEYDAITRLYKEYGRRCVEYKIYASREKIDVDEVANQAEVMVEDFKTACMAVCSNEESLCNAVLDVCYQKNKTKQFAWDICGGTIIQNLLRKNNNTIRYLVHDTDGDTEFCGERFRVEEREVYCGNYSE